MICKNNIQNVDKSFFQRGLACCCLPTPMTLAIRHCGQLNTAYHQTTHPSSDRSPIITTINIQPDYRLRQNRQTLTNYKKADWTQFTEDTESAFALTTIPTNIHTANRIFTNIILMAGKHNIPKGKMHSNCRRLPRSHSIQNHTKKQHKKSKHM